MASLERRYVAGDGWQTVVGDDPKVIRTFGTTIVPPSPVVSGVLYGIVVSPDKTKCAYVHSNGGTVEILNVASGTVVQEFNCDFSVTNTVFSPDGSLLAFSYSDPDLSKAFVEVRLADGDGGIVSLIEFEPGGQGRPTIDNRGLAFSHDGSMLAVYVAEYEAPRIAVYSTDGWTEIETVDVSEVTSFNGSLCFAPDDSYIAVGLNENISTIIVVHTSDWSFGSYVVETTRANMWIANVSISTDGSTLAAMWFDDEGGNYLRGIALVDTSDWTTISDITDISQYGAYSLLHWNSAGTEITFFGFNSFDVLSVDDGYPVTTHSVGLTSILSAAFASDDSFIAATQAGEPQGLYFVDTSSWSVAQSGYQYEANRFAVLGTSGLLVKPDEASRYPGSNQVIGVVLDSVINGASTRVQLSGVANVTAASHVTPGYTVALAEGGCVESVSAGYIIGIALGGGDEGDLVPVLLTPPTTFIND